MGKTSLPQCKQCRREGEKLFLKGERCYSQKCAIVRRNYPPGVHGNKGRPRMSGYGLQLREKQKAKRSYGILERQFRSYYEKAKAARGKTGEVMLATLESRLDNVIYRAEFASSRRLARQLVSHGHFALNGKSVNIPSLQVQAHDVITVKKNKLEEPYWKELWKKGMTQREIPAWFSVDKPAYEIRINQTPTPELIHSPLQMNLIIELYSL